jgi:16S rRNA (adenine(1408)-N(1))-methyltransferase
METIRGRASHELDFDRLTDRLAGYRRIILDLGTGDGRYVHTLAARHPDWFILGVDTCRENLYKHSRAQVDNMLFVIAAAQELPWELKGLVSHITINFPWGSLLESLLRGDPGLLQGLESISGESASLDLRLNGGALAEAGTTLEAGISSIHSNLLRAGWRVRAPVQMDSRALRSFPTTWAKRLAFGRDPRALMLSGRLANQAVCTMQSALTRL